VTAQSGGRITRKNGVIMRTVRLLMNLPNDDFDTRRVPDDVSHQFRDRSGDNGEVSGGEAALRGDLTAALTRGLDSHVRAEGPRVLLRR
jgi:hypothetical protein